MEIYAVKISDISEEIVKIFITTEEFNYIANQDLKFQLDKFYEI